MKKKNVLKKGQRSRVKKKSRRCKEIVDMLHSLSLFIYKHQLPQRHPQPQSQSTAPNWNQISARPGGGGCFSVSWRKDWIKKGEISWFWGFEGKKYGGWLCFFFFFSWGPEVDWQRVSFRVSFLQSVCVGWTNGVKKIFSEVELLYWPSTINRQGFNRQISKYSISVLLFGFSV